MGRARTEERASSSFTFWASKNSEMNILIKKRLSKEERDDMYHQIAARYDWDKIADQTIEVYEKAIS